MPLAGPLFHQWTDPPGLQTLRGRQLTRRTFPESISRPLPPCGWKRGLILDDCTAVHYNICMDTQLPDPTGEQVAWAAETFKLLADPTRLRIVWTLLHGEHSVDNFSEHVGAQPAAVSQHLAKLHLARIVQRRRQGTFFYYSIQNEHIGHLAEEALFSADHVVSDLPDDHQHRRPAHAVEIA